MARSFAASSHPDIPTWKLHAAVFCSLRLLVAVVMLVVSGCMPPVMQPWAGLNYGPGRGREPPVYADALLPLGGAISDGVMIDVSVWLAQAPAFTIVFPDGFRVPSRAVTAEVLRDHGGSLGAPSRINARLAEFHELMWESSDGVTVVFEFTGDQVTVLRFCSPTRLPDSGSRSLSFIAADGTAVTLPVTYSGMTRLFGPHVRAEKDFLLAKFSC